MKTRPARPLLMLPLLLALLVGCDQDEQGSAGTGRPRQAPAPSPEGSESGGPAPAGANLARILKSKTLRIGVNTDTPPFCYLDPEGRPRGFDVDLGLRLARHLGVQPHLVTVTLSERVEKLRRGEIDCIIAAFSATRRRAREIDFSIPYYQDQQRLLVKADSPIQSYRDLGGKKVAAIRSTTSLDNLGIVAPDAQRVEVELTAEGIEKLLKGEVDAYTDDGMTLLATRLAQAQPETLRLAGEGFSVEHYVIGLPRNDSELRNRVDEFLTELWNKGGWTRLFDKWLGARSPYNLPAQFQMPVLPE